MPISPEPSPPGSSYHPSEAPPPFWEASSAGRQAEQAMEGTASEPLLGTARKRSWTENGIASIVRTFSQGPSSESWKFKYDHFIDGIPVLEDSTFGAGKREFYRRQKEILEGYKEVDSLVAIGTFTEEEEAEQRQVVEAEALAVTTSNYVNIFLLGAKLYCCYASASLAVIASTLDSLLDLLAGFVLWFTAMHMSKEQPLHYPIGKKLMQPVGIVVFAAIMATLGLQVLVEGVRRLVMGSSGDVQLTLIDQLWLGGVLGGATLIKAALYFYCRSFDNEIVQAYAQDHIFDVITNVVSLVAALSANYLGWWLDPCGAIAISVYTIVNWSKTVFENASSLVGMVAPPEFIGKLTYLVFNHHHLIKRINKIQAWTFGSMYWVEIDLEFDKNILLRDAQLVGDSLRQRLQSHPQVERAFVQLHFET